MTPEEHYERGLKLLTFAEESREADNNANAVTDSAIAQGHFSAAAAGNAMRMWELLNSPPQEVTHLPDTEVQG
jgi:hypothetical protein